MNVSVPLTVIGLSVSMDIERRPVGKSGSKVRLLKVLVLAILKRMPVVAVVGVNLML